MAHCMYRRQAAKRVQQEDHHMKEIKTPISSWQVAKNKIEEYTTSKSEV